MAGTIALEGSAPVAAVQAPSGFDAAVLDWVTGFRQPVLTSIFTAISVVGGTVAIALVTVAIAVLMARRGRRGDAIAAIVIGFTGWLAMNAIKFAVARERPPAPPRLSDISTYSFPSGHAMVAAVFATSITLLAVRRRRILVGVLLGGWALLIGLSRVYLAAHWFSDVVAGWIFGVLWAVAGVWLWRRRRSGEAALGSFRAPPSSGALRGEQDESGDADGYSGPARGTGGFPVGTAEVHRDGRQNP